MNATIRRLIAQFTGTGLLVAIVVGSGIAATNLTGDAALRLLINLLVTAMGLAVLILIFLPAGGAQFNLVVTGADWLLGRRTEHRYGVGQAAAVVACQIAGAIAGAESMACSARPCSAHRASSAQALRCSSAKSSPRRGYSW